MNNEIEMIRAKFDDYNQGDWQQWQSKYTETAEIFYNSISDPMTAQQAVEMHEGSVRPLSAYYFDDNSIRIEKTINDKGEIWVAFYGNWIATFSGSGRQIIVPTHITYLIVDGKIAADNGYWDNTAYFQAFAEIAAAD